MRLKEKRMIVAVSCDRRPLGPKPVSHRVRPARAEVFVKECISSATSNCRDGLDFIATRRDSGTGGLGA